MSALVEPKKRFVVSADALPRFLKDYAAGRIDDPSDPRASGMQGAYPGIWDRAPWTLPRLLYHRVGIFRTIVDLPADDIWSKGWDVVTDSPDVADKVRALDQRLQIKRAFRQATVLARRDGVAIIRYRLRDATGDPSQEPRGVRGILRVEALSRDCIQRIELDKDPESDTFELPLFYHLRAAPDTDAYARAPQTMLSSTSGQLQPVKYHRDRVILVIQHPKEGRVDDGESVLSWILGDAQGHENVKWYAGEGFAQRNVPPLVVTMDKDLALDPDNNPEDKKRIDDLDAKVEKLVSGLLQKIRIGGATIEPLVGSERINPPGEYALLFRREVLAGARIPEREVTGDPAGALAAASWDVKRYISRIENDRQDFATPIVRDEHYARLDRWGIMPGLLASIKDIAWKPHLELGEAERAAVLQTTMLAVKTAREAKVPIPDEAGQLVSWPDDFDPHEIVDVSPQPPPGFGAPADSPSGPPAANTQNASQVRPRLLRPREDNLALRASRELAHVEDALAKAVSDAYAAWRAQVESAIARTTSERFQPRRIFRRNAPTPSDVQRALVDVKFESTELQAAILAALNDAGELGLLRTWSELGRAGKVRQFVNTPQASVIAQFAKNFGATKARQMSEELRNTVADTIAKGGGVAEVKTAITEKFGVLENTSTIARTESMRGWNQGALAGLHEAGIPSFEFLAYPGADNGDPDGPCNVADGEVFSVHDSLNVPPLHPNCRCAIVPIVEGA